MEFKRNRSYIKSIKKDKILYNAARNDDQDFFEILIRTTNNTANQGSLRRKEMVMNNYKSTVIKFWKMNEFCVIKNFSIVNYRLLYIKVNAMIIIY